MKRSTVIALTGLATLFFGFAFGALINFILLKVNSPLVIQYRGTLTFRSAIFGDGLLLPIANMVAVNFLLDHRKLSKKLFFWAAILGLSISAYSHFVQARRGLIDWSMPSPWHWNILGVWHMIYMSLVSTLLALFYFGNLWIVIKERRFRWELLIVTILLLVFFTLLDWDYRFIV